MSYKLGIYPALMLLVIAIYLLILHITGNFHEVIPGELYRSAQLSKSDIDSDTEKYGIKSILNLRVHNARSDWYESELSESRAKNIKHIDFPMSSSKKLSQEQALELIKIMQDAPKPLLIHCKAGSDRTGLASALYIAAIKKGSELDSELQLSLIYGHISLWFTSSFAMNETFEMLEPYLGYNGS